ncbi:hypothetical protein SUGI_1131660 [Cryptomeria japonica]|nr:hypothetical protein SUGI_1131660 [Cryptomeria japonica]
MSLNRVATPGPPPIPTKKSTEPLLTPTTSTGRGILPTSVAKGAVGRFNNWVRDTCDRDKACDKEPTPTSIVEGETVNAGTNVRGVADPTRATRVAIVVEVARAIQKIFPLVAKLAPRSQKGI